MPDRVKPLAAGVVAGLLLAVLPGGLGTVVLIASALLAGWLLPREPMTAAALFLAPGIVVGLVRVLAEDDRPSVGALVFSVVVAVFFVTILTHVGAGLALRRGSAAGRRP